MCLYTWIEDLKISLFCVVRVLQLEASTNQELNQSLPLFGLPSKILCHVMNVELKVCSLTSVLLLVFLSSRKMEVWKLARQIPVSRKNHVLKMLKLLFGFVIWGSLFSIFVWLGWARNRWGLCSNYSHPWLGGELVIYPFSCFSKYLSSPQEG